jgi:hypothetical protein
MKANQLELVSERNIARFVPVMALHQACPGEWQPVGSVRDWLVISGIGSHFLRRLPNATVLDALNSY